MATQVVRTAKAPQPVGPYSQGISVGGFVFVSGQGAIDPTSSRLVGADIESQTKQTLNNVKAIVEASGLAMRNVVRVSVYLKDMSDFKRMNEVYKSFFTDTAPARTTVQVTALPLPEMLVEIDAIAYRD